MKHSIQKILREQTSDRINKLVDVFCKQLIKKTFLGLKFDSIVFRNFSHKELEISLLFDRKECIDTDIDCTLLFQEVKKVCDHLWNKYLGLGSSVYKITFRGIRHDLPLNYQKVVDNNKDNGTECLIINRKGEKFGTDKVFKGLRP